MNYMRGRWLDAALVDLRHARHAEEGGFHSHDDARELDLYYIPTRYPNGLEAWTPAAGFGARQAARAIGGASAIVTVARRHVAAHG